MGRRSTETESGLTGSAPNSHSASERFAHLTGCHGTGLCPSSKRYIVHYPASLLRPSLCSIHWCCGSQVLKAPRVHTNTHTHTHKHTTCDQAARERTRVDLREGWEVTSIRRVGQGADLAVEATLRGPDGQEETMRPFLLVGADGLKSVVRASLCEWAQADGGDQTDRFDMLQQPSPAGGLRYKVLKLNPTFPLPPAPGSWQEAAADETGLAAPGGGDTIEAEQSYSFLSRYQGSWRDKNKETRLGLLPLKAKYAYRTANVITWPDHDLWTDPALATPEGMQQFLRDSFPQVPWDLAVTKEELARFAASPGGRFPQPQTTKGGAVWASGATGVVLVGDALHAFPPDLGQGVNSALKDVAALGDALRNVSVSSPGASGAYTMGPTEGNCREQLEPALGMYEAEATGEAKALVRMMQLGSPYQYSQPGFRAQVAAKLMAANLILRLVLSKLPILGARSPRPIFFPQISMLSQLSGDVSYREMLARAHRTTWAFAALGVATALAAAKAFLIKLAVWHTASFWGQIAMWVCLFKALGL